ncbi:MAG: hydroxyacid dehydrogenase [Opitutaceae bacterium]
MKTRPFMNAAFILPRFRFEELYGAECAAAIARATRVICPLASPDELARGDVAWLSEVELLFTGWGAPRLDRELLDRMPRLQVVFYAGGSVRPLVTDEFWRREIPITCAAAFNAQPVAEFALGAVMMGLRRAWFQASETRRLRGFPCPTVTVPGGNGSTVGLVSFGAIARRLRGYLRQFDLHVIGFDPLVSDDTFRAERVERVNLKELFARSDIVSLHSPWLPETEGLIDRELLVSMKPGATLINTARGAIVRESALIDVLRARVDLQAVLDVTWPEPPERTSPLYDLPNVFLTPHLAGSLGNECRRMGQAMVEEMRRFLRGEPLHFVVNQQAAIALA